ncbi:hypothetical protein HQ544_02540 [Candidatus Falkowbacteria bacterium]|nr:hypothetical protein [Candidatus Falkowbacteria bacterium]
MKTPLKRTLNRVKSTLKKRTSPKKSEEPISNNGQKLPFPKKVSFSFPTPKQLKYISRFLTAREKLAIKILLGFIIVSLIFFVGRFYFFHLETRPRSGGDYTEAVIGNPQFINPVLGVTSDIDKDLTSLIYSGLLKYNKEQELIPDLVSNYTISDDQKTYTFYLKKNVLWHNEEEFNANDVVFTIKTIQDPDYKSPLFVSFKGVSIEKINDYTVAFQLEEPFAPFLSILTVGILPVHLWESINPEQFGLALYNTKPIGTGPYKFKSLTKDKSGFIRSYHLEVNKEYYRRPSYINHISFKFYPDFDQAALALKNKKTDGLSYLPKEFEAEIKQDENLNILPLRLPQYAAVFFNQTENPFLKSKQIRQALTYALNKEEIIENALNRSGEIIHGPIPPGSIGYNAEIFTYSFDIEKSKELLKNSGFVGITPEEYQKLKNLDAESTTTPSLLSNQDYYLQKGREILEVNLITVSQSENQKTAEIIKKSWENVGVKVNLKIVSPAEIKETIKTRNYQALLYGIITGFDPDPYPFWHSSQNQDPGLNLAVFSNNEVDHVLEDARKTNDEQSREDKYIHFQNILTEEVPAIFLYSPTYTYVLDQKIKGFKTTRIAQPSDRFSGIENWYIKTQKALKW